MHWEPPSLKDYNTPQSYKTGSNGCISNLKASLKLFTDKKPII